MQRILELAERAGHLRHLNFLITETFELAEMQSKLAISNGRNPFSVVVKDNFAVKHIRMTCASEMLGNFTAPYNATCVERLFDSGGCLIGKSNMDGFAMGSSSTTSHFGPVFHSQYANKSSEAMEAENQTDFRVAGGSSGGCAVAVATGVADIAIGSDTGGSVRYPAALNGVYGFKPSYGRFSRHGLVPLANGLDTPSIFTRSLSECKYYFDILKGYDPMDSTSLPNEMVAKKRRNRPVTSRGLKVGIPKFHRMDLLSEDSRQVWNAAIVHLSEMGAQMCEVSLPHAEYALHAYSIIVEVDVVSNMARYDGIRYGYRSPGDASQSFTELITMNRTKALGRNVKRRILAGNFYALKENFVQFVEQAQKVQRLIQLDFERAFNQCDVLLTPCTRHSAPLLSDVERQSREEQRMDDYFTLPANLCGVPALSAPFSTCSQGLPLGIQLIGPYLEDEFLLDVAELLQHRSLK